MAAPYRFSVFTKPWKTEIRELGAFVKRLGFTGIELPVRPGYPVHPDNVTAELPRAAHLLREEFGITIESIAGPTDVVTIAACHEAKVPVIRICPAVSPGETYPQAEARYQKEWENLVPALDQHGVTLGIQNHSGRCVPVHAMGLLRLLAPFDPDHVAAVWDAAHNALEGEETALALDLICGPYLRMVNLKNAYRVRSENPDSGSVSWKTYWCAGNEGFASWSKVASELQRRNWQGVLCLTAEYSDHDAVDRMIAKDIAYAQSLFPTASA